MKKPFMCRPILAILLYAILSIYMGLHAHKLSAMIIIVFIMAITLLTIAIIFIFDSGDFSYLILISLLYFLIAFNASKTNVTYINTFAENDIPVNIYGTVTDKLNKYDDTTLYRIKVNRVSSNGAVYSDKFDIALYYDKKLTIGDNIHLYSKLRLPQAKTNPVDANTLLSYKIKGLDYKVNCNDVEIKGYTNSISSICNKLSCNIVDKIFMIFNYEEASILTAMITGDKTNLDDDIYELYRSAGIVHILAISGLHISIFAGILYLIFSYFSKRTSSILVLIFIIFYCIFTGANVSIVRATIMLAVATIAIITGRVYDLLNSVTFTCCILLLINPYNIYNIAFQYSFIAVFGIAFANDILNYGLILKKTKQYENKAILTGFVESIFVSIIAMIFIKPITMYNFYTINVVDFITNIITISVMCVIIFFAILSIAFGYISLPIARIIGLIPSYLLSFIKFISELTVNIPFGTISTGYVGPFVIIIIYTALFFLYMAFVKNKYYVIITIICSVFVINSFNKDTDYMEISFLNFNNSECTVIKNDDSCFIITVGNNSSNSNKLVNYLKYIAADKIDAIYLNELNYSDSIFINNLVDDIPIGKIILPTNYDEAEEYDGLLNIADSNNIIVQFADNNYTDNIDKSTYITSYINDDVNGKAIYRVCYNNKSILFTGNLNMSEQEKFINYNIESDILKVPGKGYKNSYYPNFVKKVSPSVAVNFSNNSGLYIHPSEEVVSIYENMNVLLYSTNRSGMVNIKIKDDIIYCKRFDEKYKEISEILD